MAQSGASESVTRDIWKSNEERTERGFVFYNVSRNIILANNSLFSDLSLSTPTSLAKQFRQRHPGLQVDKNKHTHTFDLSQRPAGTATGISPFAFSSVPPGW